MARPPLELQSLVTAARTLGANRAAIKLADEELLALVGVILRDLARNDVAQALGDDGAVVPAYFDRDLLSFDRSPFGSSGFWEVFLACVNAVPDFATYFRCLCEIHKRRRKYDIILSRQPFPTSDQIAPRVLLEYGLTDATGLEPGSLGENGSSIWTTGLARKRATSSSPYYPPR